MKNYDASRALAASGGLNPATGLWTWAEKIVDTATEGIEIITLVLPSLERRRIYLHLEAKLATASDDYYVMGELEFRKGGSSRARLPVHLGRDDNPNYLKQSLINFFPNGDPGANAINIQLASTYAGGTDTQGSKLLTPYEMTVTADEAIFRVAQLAQKGTSTKPKLRVWLGILSMT